MAKLLLRMVGLILFIYLIIGLGIFTAVDQVSTGVKNNGGAAKVLGNAIKSTKQFINDVERSSK